MTSPLTDTKTNTEIYDETIKRITTLIGLYTADTGRRPTRIYMNTRTRLALNTIFREKVIIVVPDGLRRRETVCGCYVMVCDDLPDCKIDLGWT